MRKTKIFELRALSFVSCFCGDMGVFDELSSLSCLPGTMDYSSFRRFPLARFDKLKEALIKYDRLSACRGSGCVLLGHTADRLTAYRT